MRILILLCGLALGWSAAGTELQFSFGDLAACGALTNFHAELLGGGGPVSWKVLPGEAPSAFAPLSSGAKSGGGASPGSPFHETGPPPPSRSA